MTDIPPDVAELDQDTFNAWRNHPVTKAFRQYLADFRVMLMEAHMHRWVDADELPKGGEDFERGRCFCLQEIAGLQFAHIAGFYPGLSKENEEEKENAES